MARFTNSNRIAAEQMIHATSRKRRTPAPAEKDTSYFRRIGFDVAMI